MRLRAVCSAGVLLILAACENPQLGVGATINSSGISVSPTASGQIGDVSVTVSG